MSKKELLDGLIKSWKREFLTSASFGGDVM